MFAAGRAVACAAQRRRAAGQVRSRRADHRAGPPTTGGRRTGPTCRLSATNATSVGAGRWTCRSPVRWNRCAQRLIAQGWRVQPQADWVATVGLLDDDTPRGRAAGAAGHAGRARRNACCCCMTADRGRTDTRCVCGRRRPCFMTARRCGLAARRRCACRIRWGRRAVAARSATTARPMRWSRPLLGDFESREAAASDPVALRCCGCAPVGRAASSRPVYVHRKPHETSASNRSRRACGSSICSSACRCSSCKGSNSARRQPTQAASSNCAVRRLRVFAADACRSAVPATSPAGRAPAAPHRPDPDRTTSRRRPAGRCRAPVRAGCGSDARPARCRVSRPSSPLPKSSINASVP